MSARSPTFPEQQQLNPCRQPSWRWGRASDLVKTGRYLSRKRDDEATGIAVHYLREINRCRSSRRLRRVKNRFRFVAEAREIWEAHGEVRLELESRVLARQSDVAIALAMDLPAETLQAYCDLFFDLRDRLNVKGYILWGVVGVPLEGGCSPHQLMLLSAYHHGPLVVRVRKIRGVVDKGSREQARVAHE